MFPAAELFGENGHFFLTEPRRFPAAAGLPRPAAGSGATLGACAEPLECISARMLSVPWAACEELRVVPQTVASSEEGSFGAVLAGRDRAPKTHSRRRTGVSRVTGFDLRAG